MSDIEEMAHKVGCLICGEPDDLEVKKYPHEGGVEVEGEPLKQWVYVHCNNCQYDNAWWKLEKKL